MNKCIVLDKSYLVGASSEDIGKLCSENRVLMPSALFKELMRHKTPKKRKQRAICFGKFPKTDNPIELLDTVHNLVAYEINNKKACTPIQNRIEKGVFCFHEGLSNPDWNPERPNDEDIKEWEEELSSSIKEYQEKNAEVDKIFPELKGFKPGDSYSTIQELQLKVSSNHDFIRSFVFGRYRGELDQYNIDKNWALFRETQVQLIYAIDYVRKYGTNNSNIVSQQISHDFLDMEYCITGILAEALASRDEKLREFFRLLCPCGLLIH